MEEFGARSGTERVEAGSESAFQLIGSHTLSSRDRRHALMAEFYSANLAGEIRKGMTQKAKMGGWPTKAPIGYLNVREKIPTGR